MVGDLRFASIRAIRSLPTNICSGQAEENAPVGRNDDGGARPSGPDGADRTQTTVQSQSQ
jgi:hypothetical protein